MRRKIKKLLLSITAMGIAQLSFGQQQDTLKTLQLKEVIVTATRTEKNVADVGRSITLITSDNVKSSIYNSVSELLSQQEGIYIVGNSQNPGMIQSIFSRGANSNQTLIMIDGVRITDPSTPNNAPDLSELSLANVEKIEIVRGSHSTLYGSSARKHTTVSFDEKPGIQAIKNIAAQLLPVPGNHKTVSRDFEYKRLGTVTLLAGIDLHDGTIIPLVENRHRSAEFVKYLQKLIDHYPLDWKIRIILDNHSAHRSKETMKFLDTVPNKFEFIFTPTYGSWLNMVEMFFSKIARTFLRHIRVESKAELKQRIYQGIDEINQEPVVFRWKYKLEEKKVETVEMST